MKKFLKSDNLKLVNGGYLSTGESNIPVYNADFVELQKKAEYIVTFAKHAKGKTFECGKVDSIEDVKKAVALELSADTKVDFVKIPSASKGELTQKLKDEAMAFMTSEKEVSKAKKINDFMQSFRVLKEFEEFGLFFEEDIVKLNKLYTVADVLAAVKETIDIIE